MRKIEVVEYNPAWPERFTEESSLMRETLGDIVGSVHHIGSTAVPGLAAKPVIDILVEVTDLAALDARNQDMELIGYEPMGEFGIPETTASLDTIGVHLDYQGQGLAIELMKEFVTNLRKAGVERIYTLINWNDWELLRFFEKSGFVPAKVVNLELQIT